MPGLLEAPEARMKSETLSKEQVLELALDPPTGFDLFDGTGVLPEHDGRIFQSATGTLWRMDMKVGTSPTWTKIRLPSDKIG